MTQNWILAIYKKDDTVKKEFKILDRTESEANNEATRYIENFRITNDWTLREGTEKEMAKLNELD